MSQNLQSLFFNKVAGPRPETLAQMFSCEFREFLRVPTVGAFEGILNENLIFLHGDCYI